jgi:hypothetical protein
MDHRTRHWCEFQREMLLMPEDGAAFEAVSGRGIGAVAASALSAGAVSGVAPPGAGGWSAKTCSMASFASPSAGRAKAGDDERAAQQGQ